MKKLFLAVFLCTAFLLMGTTASAVPYLQLDIVGSSSTSGTTVGGESGTLMALIDPTKHAFDATNNYFITLSINPLNTTYAGTAPTLSDFNFSSIYVPSGGTGTPSLTLSGTTAAPYPQVNHGEGFPSTYWTFGAFGADGSQTIAAYDVQTDTPGPNHDLYVVYFDYDFSGIIGSDGVKGIHFDLYAENTSGDFVDKAPFSHDASAVPEPATLLLLGGGLVGLAGFGRKRFKK